MGRAPAGRAGRLGLGRVGTVTPPKRFPRSPSRGAARGPVKPDPRQALDDAARDGAADVQIRTESPDQPELVALMAELDAYQSALYPPESNHLLDLAALQAPGVRFVVARGAQGEALGIGAVVLKAGYGEVKRMYVPPPQRGRGIARALLGRLEAEARDAGLGWLKLETGIAQPEALRLYERAGFMRCAPFGDYHDDPLSVFMDKPLA